MQQVARSISGRPAFRFPRSSVTFRRRDSTFRLIATVRGRSSSISF